MEIHNTTFGYSVEDLLELIDKYDFASLQPKCIKYLINSKDNLLFKLRIADKFGLAEVEVIHFHEKLSSFHVLSNNLPSIYNVKIINFKKSKLPNDFILIEWAILGIYVKNVHIFLESDPCVDCPNGDVWRLWLWFRLFAVRKKSKSFVPEL